MAFARNVAQETAARPAPDDVLQGMNVGGSSSSAPTLSVAHPDTFVPERRYIIETLFNDLLGLPVTLHTRPGLEGIEISRTGSDHLVRVADGLFAHDEDGWPQTLPPYPDVRVRIDVRQEALAARLVEPWVPRLWGPDGVSAVQEEHGSTRVGLDIFGTAFALLTGLEELYPVPRDGHGRLGAADSLAGRAGFLDRPIVDELAALLGGLLEQHWPDLHVVPRRPQVVATHDVDRPYGTWGRSMREVLGFLKGDLLQRRSPALAINRSLSLVKTRMVGPRGDFHQNFDFLMDASDRSGLTSTFLFIDRRGEGFGEPRYAIDDPQIGKVMQNIGARGHRLGLHGSYTSFDDAERLVAERRHLQEVIAAQGIQDEVRMGRQHYLRFQNPATWRAAVAAGLSEDTTFAFADHPGFRAGTARPYRLYDLMARTRLPLVERPLLFMEGSCFQYLGYGWSDTRRLADRLAGRAFRYGGDFVFLWHPSMVNTPGRRRQYRRFLRGWVRRAAAMADRQRLPAEERSAAGTPRAAPKRFDKR